MGGLVYDLRSMIYGKYPSEAKFARVLGWTRQKLNKITTGNKMPDIIELCQMSKELNVPLQSMADIFIAQEVNKRMTSKQNTAQPTQDSA